MIFFLQMIDTPEDKSKFMRIYETYKGLMYHIAYGILDNKEDSEDAVQNAFIKIAKNIEKIEEPVSLKTKSFIAIIVERKAIDILRARQRQQTEELTDSSWNETVQDDFSDDGLARCMLDLPKTYREFILLKYHHGYSVKEISEILGLSFFAAAKLSQRAKKKLENLCKDAGLL